MKQLNLIKDFFNPSSVNYQLSVGKEVIIVKIKEVLDKSNGIFTSNDISGLFTGENTFEFHMIPAVFTNGLNPRTTLKGVIIETNSEKVTINITLKPNVIFYFLFFLIVFLAIAFPCAYFAKPFPVSFLQVCAATVTIFVTPFLIIMLANISGAAALERFETIIKPFQPISKS